MKDWMTAMFLGIVCFLLTCPSPVMAGKLADKKGDDSPNFFFLFSSTGNEKFQVECKQTGVEAVNCNFIGTRIKQPVKVDPQNLSDKEKREWQADLSKNSKEDRDRMTKMEEKLLDTSLGPKSKAYVKSFIEAYKTGDVERLHKIVIDKDSRTCQVFVQSFSLEFKKIGHRKWLSNPGPGGRCQILKIYELTGEESHNLWQMTETRVTAGSNEGICQDVEQELNKPTIWSWKNPQEYELACDFITYDIFMAH